MARAKTTRDKRNGATLGFEAKLSLAADKLRNRMDAAACKNVVLCLIIRQSASYEIETRTKKKLVQSRPFTEMPEKSIRVYQNRAIETAKVIEELTEPARRMREVNRHTEDLKRTKDELPFYVALETNDNAVKVPGDTTLRIIAQDLVETVRRDATIDRTVRETVRAKLRAMVGRIPRKYGYPPDKQARASETVLRRADLLHADWAAWHERWLIPRREK